MKFSYITHLSSWEALVTSYEETRAGFIKLALEKATPFVEEANALNSLTSKVKIPLDLMTIEDINPAILTAAGISDKASKHLTEEDKNEAIKGLIENFLEPAGKDFIDELIYRYLLIRGDTVGGSMRNLAGALGEQKMTRTLISTLRLQGIKFSFLHRESNKWIDGKHANADVEKFIRGLSWNNENGHRILLYNLTVPLVNKNVDLCLINSSSDQFIPSNNHDSCHKKPSLYIALGELKAGIDPEGADEHWKTANFALNRIRGGFKSENFNPKTFFVGAAIEQAMAKEIFSQLETGQLSNAANLTDDIQLVSVCKWLIDL